MAPIKFITIHNAPAHLSPAELQQKMEALLDTAAAVPIIQKHALKLEIVCTPYQSVIQRTEPVSGT
jgi:hypothetical protein